MNTKMIIHQSNINVPISSALINILYEEMTLSGVIDSMKTDVTLNFRDQQYSAENGGFHPVEIRLVRRNNEWHFDYLTDFSYMGRVYPELEKEFDVSWSMGYIWYYVMGDIDAEEGGELFELWQRNFIQYWKVGIYTVTVS